MMTMITIFGKLPVIITSAACAVSAHPLTLQHYRSAACLRYQQTAADRSLRQTAAIMCVEKQKKNDVSGF